MAHLSGYTGSISFTTAPGTTATWSGGHSASTTQKALKLVAWSLEQDVTIIRAMAKSENWVTKFAAQARYSGSVEWLVQDDWTTTTDVSHDAKLRVDNSSPFSPKTIIGTLITATGDAYSISGWITGLTLSNPLDGPVSSTCTFIGDGALTFSAS